MRLLLVILLVCSVKVLGQTVLFKTRFVPYSVTYNGSDNPNECWESVDNGILVESSTGTYFFTLPAGEFERLSETLISEEVVVEVVFYDEPSYGSGADGTVVKITMEDAVIFPEK